jgi:hypothetical protein
MTNLTMQSVLAEFVSDCDAVGDSYVGHRWPDLKITLDKARDVLSAVKDNSRSLNSRESAIVLYALRRLQYDIAGDPCPLPTTEEFDLHEEINVEEIHTLCEKINLG